MKTLSLTLVFLAAAACGTRQAAAPRIPSPQFVLATSPELLPLERDLRARIAQDSAGEVAVALIDLASGRTLGISQDVSMHAASTMKVPVMMELFRQADAGRHRIGDSITVINTFRSIADTSHYTLATDRDTNLVANLGRRLSLQRIAHSMITVSSNLSTNILIDYLTADSVRRTMAAIGAQDMVVLRGVSDDPAFRRGMNNMTTAAALARALEVVARCSMHTRPSCDGMMAMLEGQAFRSEIPAGVPPGVRVGNKTGSITGHLHDAAIVMPPGRAPYVLVVLTRGAANPRAATAIAVDVSRQVWEHLGGTQTSTPGELRASVQRYVRAHDADILAELRQLLAIPNVATDTLNIRRNAAHLQEMLRTRGFAAELLEAPSGRHVPPAVFAEMRVPGASRTVVFYAHYDGQPVTRSQWADDPWTPTLRTAAVADGGERIPFPTTPGNAQGEWRIHARSASDDKAPIVALLRAIDALRAAGRQPSVNVKVFLDGEEEAGSEHLVEILERHRERLGADLWLFGDGPVHQSRAMQVVFGVRGVTGLEMTVFGARRPLHSGHYGNWAPNPAVLLTHLLASMRDPDGRITIAGYMDGVAPLSEAEQRAIAAMPASDSALRAELQLAATEGSGALLAERIMLPALNVRGIRTGGVGDEAANAIMTEAHASIDFRLVPDQTPERVRQLVEAHLRAQGFHVVQEPPTAQERQAHARIVRVRWDGGYGGVRTPIDLPVSQALLRTVEQAIGTAPVAVPMLGGSLPIEGVARVLGAPLIVLPIVNHDNNQHGANENLRLQNLFDGIVLYAGVLAGLGANWR